MKEKTKLLLISLIFVGVILCGSLLYSAIKTDYETNIAPRVTSGERQAAPDFEMLDQQGNTVKLSDFKGKGVVLNFWASWCPYCVEEMPDFENEFLSVGEDVQFVMLNVTDGGRETLDLAKSFIEKAGFTFPVFYDTTLEGAQAYNVSGLPVTYFIDKDGNVASQNYGRISANALRDGIELIK